MNCLGMHFSFLWPQGHHAVLLGSSSRRRPASALDNNGTHYFPVVGMITVAFFSIYVNWNSFSALDTCPTCHFLSSPRGYSCALSYCSTPLQGRWLHSVADTGLLKLGVVTCNRLKVQMKLVATFWGVYVVSLPELEATVSHKKGTRPIDVLPG